MFRIFWPFVMFLTLSINVGWAHEYYLLPETFTPKAGQEFGVEHRLGQKFKGSELPYIKKWNIRSEVWEKGVKRDERGLDGDRPALKVTATQPGLLIAVHQSNVDFLTFNDWEKFQKYVRKEGIAHALKDSEDGLKPKVGLIEGYARYAKALVNVDGDNTGLDQPTGLKIELVALKNPMALNSTEPMPVQLLYDGKPLNDARITVFIGIGNDFSHQIQTDENGKAQIPAAGPGPYLLNAIHMTDPQGKDALAKGAHWESFWASLTFKRGD